MPLHVGLPTVLFFLLWCNADSVLAGGDKLNRTTLDLDSVLSGKKNSSTLSGAQDLSIAGSTPRSDQDTEARGIGVVSDWLSNLLSINRRPEETFHSLGLHKLDRKLENEPNVKIWFKRVRQYRARGSQLTRFNDYEVFLFLAEHAPVETVLKVLEGNGMKDFAIRMRNHLKDPKSPEMEGLIQHWISAKLHPSRVYHLLGLKTDEGLVTDSLTLDLTKNLEVLRWLKYTARYTGLPFFKPASTSYADAMNSAYAKVEEMLLPKSSDVEEQARHEFKYAAFLQTMQKDRDLAMLAHRLIFNQHDRLKKKGEMLPLDFLQQLVREKGTDLNLRAKDSQTLAVKAYFVRCAPVDYTEDLAVIRARAEPFPDSGFVEGAFERNDLKEVKGLPEKWKQLQDN